MNETEEREEEILEAETPTYEDTLWGHTMRDELLKEPITSLNASYFKIFNICILLFGAYLAGIPLFKEPVIASGKTYLRFLAFCPLVFLVLGVVTLFYGLASFSFDLSAKSPTLIKDTYEKTISKKYQFMRTALILIVISVIFAIINIWIYFGISKQTGG
jgi:hypothetical protein